MPDNVLNQRTVYVPQVSSGQYWLGERTHDSLEDAREDFERIQTMSAYENCRFRLLERTITEVVLEYQGVPR